MKFLCALLILGAAELAAQTQTMVTPDCPTSGIVSTNATAGPTFDNRPILSPNPGTTCTTWVLTYTALTGTPTISISVQEAPNNNGAPGSFSNISGATSTSTPSGSILIKNSAGTGYYPFIRVFVTTISSGSVSWVLNGWRDNAGSVNAGSGGGGSGCPGTVGTPCVVAGTNGAAQALVVGTSQADVSVSAGTDVVLVSGTAAKTTYIPKFDIAWDNSADLSIRQGTGSTCGSGTSTLAGPYKSLTAIFEDYGGFAPLHSTATGVDICLHWSASVTGGGQVFSAQF